MVILYLIFPVGLGLIPPRPTTASCHSTPLYIHHTQTNWTTVFSLYSSQIKFVSDKQTKGMAACASLLVVAFLVSWSLAEAREYLVGGKSDAWAVPSSEAESLNKWAETKRFRTGDVLVWKYDGAKDSVLYVSKEDYVKCNTSKPIKEYKDGETKIVLDKSGPFYFISGNKEQCIKGQKLVVVVMTSHRSTHVSPAPSPSSSDVTQGPATAPAPTSAASTPFKAVALLVLVMPALLFT